MKTEKIEQQKAESATNAESGFFRPFRWKKDRFPGQTAGKVIPA